MPDSGALKRNLLVLHITVFVWGFTGLLGALISVDATQLVWYRVLIAFISLFLYFKVRHISMKVSLNTFLKLFFTGAIVGAHWILFFQAIKSSTVSVTLVCLSSLTLFTAILEPVFYRKKISSLEIITGLAIISGIYLIFEFEGKYTLGIILGLLSALCASVFSIINSKQIKNRDASIISFYELAGAWFWITIYICVSGEVKSYVKPGISDTIYLLILGTICTSVAYVAGVAVMRSLSAFRVALITNLEPVYGIILANIFLGKSEQMTLGFYAGAVIILTSVFMYPYIRNRIEKRNQNKIPPLV